jgi:hypothetical protein
MAYFIVILSVVMQSVFIPCVTFLIVMLSVIIHVSHFRKCMVFVIMLSVVVLSGVKKCA